jgi:DNA-binding MarR family transcriptional regulator
MASGDISSKIAAIHELQAALMEPGLKKLKISWTSFQLLMAVSSGGGKLSQATVSQRLGITPATLSEAVRVQVEKGWLKQIGSDTDRRVKYLATTQKAEKLLASIRELIAEIEDAGLKGLTKAERAALSQSLDEVVANLRKRLG